ncbi:MAG: GDSL-type esterase/lipase family protein [Limisphaerales bacterium]
MKPYLPIFLAASLLAYRAGAESLTGSTNFVPAVSPEIVIEGRYAPSNGVIRLGFCGTVLHFRYHGSQLAMRVEASTDEVYFDVGVDGGEPVRLRCRAGEGDYPLLENAATTDHVLEITRRSESWQGTCEIIGLKLGDAGKLLSPPALPARKLMFIGDSITCGAATDIRPDDPLKGKTAHEDQNSNARLSYGKILARKLNAQCVLVSYGGRGVIRDWQGIRNINNAPQFYELALPDDPSCLWQQNSYEPDAIAICLGTNDFNQGVPDENEFVNAYVEFIRKIRRDSPNARIFLLDSPMLEDAEGKAPKRTMLHAYLQEIVAKVNSPQVQLASVSHYAGIPGNGHPTRADHESIAKELEPQFRQALNW